VGEWRISKSQFVSIYAYRAYTLLHRTTKFNEVTHYGEERVLAGQSSRCILHKCVAEFVSDS